MRRIRWMMVAAALVLPASALANNSSARSAAEKQCRTERQHMGSETFKSAFGTNKNKSNAFAKCVSHRTTQNTSDQHSAQTSAEKQCRAEQSDPTFSMDGKSFSAFYGSGKNGKNAFGKCVSTTAHSMADQDEGQQVSDEDNAAKACRAEQQDPAFSDSHGGKSFSDFYGTNHNHRNAFGKCVSEKARAQEQEQQQSSS